MGIFQRITPMSRPPSSAELAAQLAFSAVVALAIGWQAQQATTLPDFAVFWAAQRTPTPYNPSEYLRLLGPGERHFPYPPTFLLLTSPLRWTPYQGAYLAWGVASISALLLSLRQRLAPLVLLFPEVFMAGLNGQTSLLIAAALFAAASLPQRPLVSGLLYGLAACIKPQVGVLIPFALVAAGQWRIIGAAAATTAVLFGLSAIAYGPHLWLDWWTYLPRYVAANDAALAGRYIALPGLWKLPALLLGAVGAWTLGRHNHLVAALFVAISGALLGSLHAMDYDLAILAPFALALILAAVRLTAPTRIGYKPARQIRLSARNSETR